MSKKDLKRETARDILALGSWIFYILVIARALIKPYRPFADQLIIAAIIIIILSLLIKNSDTYISRTLALVFFTSLFYQDNLFTTFATMVGLSLILSSYYINKNYKTIIKGIIIGTIATATGYLIPNL